MKTSDNHTATKSPRHTPAQEFAPRRDPVDDLTPVFKSLSVKRRTLVINKQQPLLRFVILSLLAASLFTNAKAQQPSEEQLARILKRFPEADRDKDGKLSTDEVQQFVKLRQRNIRPAAAAQPTQAGDVKLTETLGGMNARFKNVQLELLKWPSELHKQLGKMTKLALVTRPVKKVEGKLPLH